jgi:glycosyltransferase involved in cell wall biosynthesis
MRVSPGHPAATVILPVFNCAFYLREAIDSILAQTFTDFELLLLDDGSTDGSLEIMRAFAAQDARCKVHTRDNRGLVYTLNEGIELAAADILFRMDGDDKSLSGRFEAQMVYLRAHPECVAVGTECYLIDPDGRPLRPFGVPCAHSDIDARHLRGLGGAIPHPSVAMRKAAVLAVGGYRAEFTHSEDLDLFLRLAEIGTLANLPEVLFEYRQHPRSIGHQHAEAQRLANSQAVAAAKLRRRMVEGSNPPQPQRVTGPMSPADVHCKWAWWALSAGNLTTARRHAFRALRYAPFAPETLRLVACVLRGH